MKRFFLLLSMAVGLLCAAQAAVPDSVVCIVMDSANSLLPEVKITNLSTKKTYVTGVDGRVKMPLKASQKVKIERSGYETQNQVLAAKTEELLIRLVPKKSSARSNADRGSRDHGRRPAELGRTVDSKYLRRPATDEVYMLESEPAPSGALVATDVYAEREPLIDLPSAELHSAVAEANAPSAGKLTAGEVNDFAKWALWDSIILGSHSRFVEQWGLHLDSRYVAQVVNEAGYPLANRFVSLLDGQGNTLFSARTDNTGKAELWDGLTGKPAQGALFIEADGIRVAARPFGEGLNLIRLGDACGAETKADVFFVVDATGSMGDELRYMQAEMKDVIARSQGAVEGLSIRTGALVYRDYSDSYLTRISRLTNDINETQVFIDKQYAGGGGDFEEAVPEALKAALNVAGWDDEARTRIIFLVLDAPCHDDSATIAMLHEQVRNAAAMGVRIVPVVCSGLDNAGELLMRELALATNGTSFFLTDDSGIGNTHLKPTTDTLKVEHLNDMLVRTIVEFCSMPACDVAESLDEKEIERFLPNPTDQANDPSAPVVNADEVLRIMPNPCHDVCRAVILQPVEMLYLVDMTGKTVKSWSKLPAVTLQVQTGDLSTGVYFFKTYFNGRWITRKLIVA